MITGGSALNIDPPADLLECEALQSPLTTKGSYPIGLFFDLANASKPGQSLIEAKAFSLIHQNLISI